MSGHSKWATIKRAKGTTDAKRGILFTKLSKNISLAARRGKDPEMNSALRTAIDAARGANMPKDNIERAILRGAGELPGQQLEEITYEGYGPGGVALLLRCVTDNTNRTSSNLRATLSKGGGKLGGPGTVSYLFKQRGVLRVSDASEAMQLKAMDAGVEDVAVEDDGLTLYTSPQQFETIKASFGTNASYAQVDMVPDTTIGLSSGEATAFDTLLTTLEDDDDVVTIYHNAK